jgi:signal transduction histidine kinase
MTTTFGSIPDMGHVYSVFFDLVRRRLTARYADILFWGLNVVKADDETLAEIENHEAPITAEVELDALLRALPDIYFRLDREGRIVAFHSARENELHVPPAQFIGRRAQDLVPPEVAPIIGSAVERVLSQRIPARIEYTLATPSGDDQFEAHLVPCGESGVTTLIRNTTAQIRAEAALRVSEERLLAAQKLDAIGQLAGGIAHDFNNVLGVMLGRLGFLKRSKGLSASDLDHVNEALDAASHGAALTRQLMSFSRKQPVNRSHFDLNAVIAARQDMLRRMLGEHIALTLTLSELPVTVLSDPTQLEQVLFNLVLNARQAMPNGGNVTVATSIKSEKKSEGVDDRHAILTVTDTGCGMAPEVLEHVFEPFFTTKSRDQGTGIGLATVHDIVKQSGGRVVVKSEVGVGSTFEIAFPFSNA